MRTMQKHIPSPIIVADPLVIGEKQAVHRLSLMAEAA
jgi:hypothetical protein